MAYAEKRAGYWRGRYRLPDGRLVTVCGESGEAIRFTGKREAERAAQDKESEARGRVWRDPALGQTLFADYANDWYACQDLAASTMQNYRRHIEEHLLPFFGEMAVGAIKPKDIADWERTERSHNYKPASIKTWRATLHLILEDAKEEGLRDSNPATRRRGRGRRDGRHLTRGVEKTVTDALGILLIAERAALLSGRDDEFVALILLGYTGMRWGELVGLEKQYVRSAAVRVEWQLYELDNGELHRCPPKDGSRRTVDVPAWLSGLLSGHLARTAPTACRCHGLVYAFGGHGAPNGAARRPGPKLVDVARQAGVSTGTVSNVLNRPETVPDATRVRVLQAVTDLGYVQGEPAGERAAHWRRNGFATWLFQPAVTGSYPAKAPQPSRPVPLLADPWPGVPVRGRNAAGRAELCWLPLAHGLTPHGLRHTHKTLMEELGTPPKLMDERMGHEDGSVQSRYTHVTGPMRDRLMAGLTDLWAAALDARRAMAPRSPVAVLDRLLADRAGEVDR
ncbi:hypothetical protein Val02_93320 [Virgisporangium aliadipatigenens]|uniref:LacI family transcriptional regulator n=1 Tax=Virgisporangium aliadipatigenens TaxID=741659 RepID=A0A8J3YZ91_9ACTN|nr:LacI family DNA-binding transcriptional regulator [Virgisporangium aliadipatigenens]GIJ52446.1 hypothetical protein Val02_93320 [Virgisporangium aliadipatigenens]